MGRPSLPNVVLAALVASLVSALALTGCSAATQKPGTDTGLDVRLAGQWVLDRASDNAGDITGVYASLTIGHGTASGGRGPCSDYSARIVGKPGAVFVTASPARHSICTESGLRNLDVRYFAALRASDVATVSATSLSLRGARTTLVFRRAPYVSAADFIDVVWNAKAESFGIRESKRFADGEPTFATSGTMVFSQDGSFSAEVGNCGPAIGKWAIQAGEVVVKRSTRAAIHCTERVDTDRLNALLEAVDEGFQFTRSTNTMVTTNPRTLDVVRFILPEKVVF